MLYSTRDWQTAISKLIQMTVNGELKWRNSDINNASPDEVIENALQAEQKEKIYVVSQSKYKYYYDEDNFSWKRAYNLSVYQNNFSDLSQIAQAPSMNLIESLFDIAQNSCAYSNNALSDLL
ncbi:hypothetical protein [Acetobacter thailandicus]|uniref:Uncharacterized protein n=1 Tax=Acetobacter thailandicus TaxID=1502842 RepID=A0ABT3QC74_9PROT|nr:hypothetical protein [Acetobacter thailandicus]MCX2562860.1 hypothetical protein [Acetobacter thailandicus]NHN95733.1 hypothetical protein [Acetobacter thailandicus]